MTTVQEKVSDLKAEEETKDITEKTIETVEINNGGYIPEDSPLHIVYDRTKNGENPYRPKICFNVLENDKTYTYSMTEFFFNDAEHTIQDVRENAYIPNPLVEDIFKTHQSIEYQVDYDIKEKEVELNLNVFIDNHINDSDREDGYYNIDSVKLSDIAKQGEDAFWIPSDDLPENVKSLVEDIQEQAETDFIQHDLMWKVSRKRNSSGNLNSLVVEFDNPLLDDLVIEEIITEDGEWVADELVNEVDDAEDILTLDKNVELYVDENLNIDSIGTKDSKITNRFNNIFELIPFAVLNILTSPCALIPLFAIPLFTNPAVAVLVMMFSPFVAIYNLWVVPDYLNAVKGIDEDDYWERWIAMIVSPLIWIVSYFIRADAVRWNDKYRLDKLVSNNE